MSSTVTQKQLDVLDSLDEKYQERMESNIDCILDEQDEELLLTYLRSSNSIIRAGAVDLLRYSNAATTRDTLIDCAKRIHRISYVHIAVQLYAILLLKERKMMR